MKIRRTYTEWFRYLSDPQAAFSALGRKSLEQLLAEYAVLLVCAGLGAGLFLLLKSLAWAAVYSLVLEVDVQYYRLLNYALGGVTSAIFFYIFAGTFLLFLISLAAQGLLKLSYVDTLRLLISSSAPLLLFGWIIPAVPGLLIWTLVLISAGLPILRRARRRQKGTIGERE